MARHTHYTAEIARLEKHIDSFGQKTKALEDFVSQTAHLRDKLEDATPDDKAEICQLVISRVTISEDGIHVSFGSNLVESRKDAPHPQRA